MLKSTVFLVADRVIRDSDTNNLSIINILEDITAESYPIIIQRITAIGFLTREEVDSELPQIKFSIYNNDKEIVTSIVKIDFRQKSSSKAIIKMNAIPLHEAGMASFILKDEKDVEIAKYVINLKARDTIQIVNN